MIRREVMEALFPDFVKKLDETLAEITAFNKEVCPTIPQRKKRKPKPPSYFARIAILAAIRENDGPMKLDDIYDKLKDSWAYHTLTNNILYLVEKGELERVRRAVYAIKEAP